MALSSVRPFVQTFAIRKRPRALTSNAPFPFRHTQQLTPPRSSLHPCKAAGRRRLRPRAMRRPWSQTPLSHTLLVWEESARTCKPCSSRHRGTRRTCVKGVAPVQHRWRLRYAAAGLQQRVRGRLGQEWGGAKGACMCRGV